MEIGILTAFLAGIVSFLSPCVLPLAPPYLAYLGGTTLDQISGERQQIDKTVARRVFISACFFVMGLATVFVLLGMGASIFGQFLVRYKPEFSFVAGGLIYALGLHFYGLRSSLGVGAVVAVLVIGLAFLTGPGLERPGLWIDLAWIGALSVASLETLLCLEATDKLDPFKRVSPANRELKAQGVANVVSGLIGGLPITQVIVRSSTNIQSGGRTKMSAILHGFILLISAMAIPFLLNLIPLASLAAILFLVGYKLAKPVLFKQMYSLGQSHFVPFMVTILGIVFTDLLMGIGMGLAVAIFYVLYNNYKKPFLFEDKHFQDGKIHLALAEDVTFINKASIQRTLSQIPDSSKVIIDASKTINIDYDVLEIIEEFEVNAKHRDIDLTIIERERKGVVNQVKKMEQALVDTHVPLNGNKVSV